MVDYSQCHQSLHSIDIEKWVPSNRLKRLGFHLVLISALIQILFSFLLSFLQRSRTDLSEVLESQLKTDVMLVAGSLASHLHTVRTMANHLNKTKSTLVLIDGVGDVLMEAVSPLTITFLFTTFRPIVG